MGGASLEGGEPARGGPVSLTTFDEALRRHFKNVRFKMDDEYTPQERAEQEASRIAYEAVPKMSAAARVWLFAGFCRGCGTAWGENGQAFWQCAKCGRHRTDK